MTFRTRLPRRYIHRLRMRAVLLLAFLSMVAVEVHAAASIRSSRWGPTLLPDTHADLAGSPGESPVVDTLQLAEAIAIARTTNPRLAANRFLAEAAAERVPQAGALPDPQVTLGLMNRPLYGFGSDEPMTMNQLQVSQMFPWPGKLGYAQERAQYLATAATLSAEEAEVALIGMVKREYFELASMDRAITIMEGTRELLRDFFQVSQAMYAVGDGLQQDVLRAQVAVAQMTEEITAMSQRRIAMAARLNALLGRDAAVPIQGVVLPEIGSELASLDSLLGIATRQRPALLAAQERERAAVAGLAAARRELYPDLMVAVAYGQRERFGDMGTVMVGFNLPLRAGSRQRPMAREMEAMRAMEGAMARDLYNDTFAELAEARADAERARALGTLYAASILPQARAAVESALSAYRVGQVDYMTLVENEMTVNRYEIESVRLAAQYHQAVARIDALLGPAGGAR
ncbi:MAG: TolC family protein [Gemmatimonadales bacterium]|nr:TolC family protein [Gemmatimonadales bacterium]